MSGDVTLRPMTPHDVGAVAGVWWRSSMSSFAGDDHPSEESLRARLVREPWSVTLAVAGAEVIGLLAVQADEYWLRQLYVDVGDQGHGVGGALLKEARRQMPEGFFLHTEADNTRARRFYERRGLRLTEQFTDPGRGTMRVRYDWTPAARGGA